MSSSSVERLDGTRIYLQDDPMGTCEPAPDADASPDPRRSALPRDPRQTLERYPDWQDGIETLDGSPRDPLAPYVRSPIERETDWTSGLDAWEIDDRVDAWVQSQYPEARDG